MKEATRALVGAGATARVWRHFLPAILLAAFLRATLSNGQGSNEANLPIISLESTNQIVSERKVSCTMSVQEAKGSAATNRMPAIARVHGGVSQSFSKKSYGITLDTPVSLLGMRRSSHWLLNAAYIDRSLMRHKLSYDLFRALSTSNAPRFAVASRFVEVRLN